MKSFLGWLTLFVACVRVRDSSASPVVPAPPQYRRNYSAFLVTVKTTCDGSGMRQLILSYRSLQASTGILCSPLVTVWLISGYCLLADRCPHRYLARAKGGQGRPTLTANRKSTPRANGAL